LRAISFFPPCAPGAILLFPDNMSRTNVSDDSDFEAEPTQISSENVSESLFGSPFSSSDSDSARDEPDKKRVKTHSDGIQMETTTFSDQMETTTFSSWGEFHEEFEDYCRRTYQVYRVRSSRSIDLVNKSQKLDFLYTKECGSYFDKKYVCTHGWSLRQRGKHRCSNLAN
jgi:hypothetical protein